MKKKRNICPILILVLCILGVVGLVRHFHIKNFHVVEPGVLYTSGQPRGMDYTRLLYKYHIGTIINLRSPAEHREKNWYNEEITWVRGNGIKYFDMPLDRKDDSPLHFPDPNMQKQLLSIMEVRENLPVLVHDSSGESRVAMVAALWLVKSQGRPLEQVLAEAEDIKDSALAETETAFIQSLYK